MQKKGIFSAIKHTLDPFAVIQNYLEKTLYARSKKIVATADEMKDEIIKYYNINERKIIVIRNPIYTELYKFNKKKRNEIRKSLGIRENELVLMFAGHDYKRKGLNFVIDALKYIDCKLLVIGKDDENPYIKMAKKLGVNNRIFWIGLAENIEDYFSAGDLFVFPSYHEETANVMLQAMSSSMPVLMAKTGGASLIDNGINGYIIEQDGKKIAETIKNIKNLKKLRHQAREKMLNYTTQKVAGRYVKLFEEVIKCQK
jgi:UDP-glucose:(heptosyl)LPS alpha-1,3-glucosyltransferase